MELTQDIKIICQNSIIKGTGAQTFDGHPLRNWKIKLVAVDNGKEKKGRLSELLDHVEYILHPTFTDPRRVVTKEPYLLQEKGWGEFDMRIVLYFVNNIANTELLSFDLNFTQAQYSVTKTVVFQSPAPELVNILSREPAPLPPAKKRRSTSTEKSRKSSIIKSPISPKNVTSMTGMDSLSGTSLSPSTPYLQQQQQQQQGISGNSYSASPQPNSFNSPSNGVMNSPYDYTQNIKTPQATSATAEYDSLHNYFPDLSDDPRSRPALQQQQQQHDNNNNNDNDNSQDQYNRRRKNKSNNSSNHNNSNRKQNGHRGHPSDTNGDDKNEDDEARIVDDVYSESDLDHIDPIHGEALSTDLRRAWGIPEHVNMLELAKRISSLDGEKLAEIRSIVDRYKTSGMGVTVEDSKYFKTYKM
ncbi:yeats family-domain-containing protein [Circinella umbellata]|nr:yeats family-domain-containing protein [Circinella umbellata]